MTDAIRIDLDSDDLFEPLPLTAEIVTDGDGQLEDVHFFVYVGDDMDGKPMSATSSLDIVWNRGQRVEIPLRLDDNLRRFLQERLDEEARHDGPDKEE